MTAKPVERKYTSADLLAMPDDGKHYELIYGEIVEVGTSSKKHSTLGAWLVFMLLLHIKTNKLGGCVAGADGTYQLGAGNTRAPDVSYLTAAKAAKASPFEPGFWPFAPDFVIEIKSPSNSPDAMHGLAELYISSGSRLVWTIDYEKKTAKVYRHGKTKVLEVGAEGLLDAGAVVPGFKISLAEAFSEIENL